jgi:hypothetical protein
VTIGVVGVRGTPPNRCRASGRPGPRPRWTRSPPIRGRGHRAKDRCRPSGPPAPLLRTLTPTRSVVSSGIEPFRRRRCRPALAMRAPGSRAKRSCPRWVRTIAIRARAPRDFLAEGPTTIVLLISGLDGWQLHCRRLTPGAGIKGPLCQAIAVMRRRFPSMCDEHDAHENWCGWSARLA